MKRSARPKPAIHGGWNVVFTCFLIGGSLGCASHRNTSETNPTDSAVAASLDPAPLPAASPLPNATMKPTATPAPAALDPKAAARLADLSIDKASAKAIEGLSNFSLSESLGHIQPGCSSPRKNNSRFVVLIKQWHPSPSVNTLPRTPGRERDLLPTIPQAENQIAIYKMLEGWVGDGALKTVLVEGCGSGIRRGFETRFNGWNLRALERRATQPDYAAVMTHVGLKLEGKLGPVVDVTCADSEELIKAHSLAFSDARGVIGFLSRLDGARDDDPKARAYLSGVVDIYRLPPSTTVAQAVTQLRTELKDVIGRIQRGFEERNKVMIRRILEAPNRPMALVVGGAHVPDLKERLEKEGVACAIIQPEGYRSEDDELMGKLLSWSERTP